MAFSSAAIAELRGLDELGAYAIAHSEQCRVSGSNPRKDPLRCASGLEWFLNCRIVYGPEISKPGQRVPLPTRNIHGTQSAYRNYGCRCEECVAANRLKDKETYARHAALGLCRCCGKVPAEIRCAFCTISQASAQRVLRSARRVALAMSSAAVDPHV